MRRLPVVLAAGGFLVAVACSNPDRIRTPDTPDSMSAVAPARVDSASFSADDFKRLAWLHGRWEGFMPGGGRFYQEYRMVDDSTILMRAFGDSAFARATDSARITLRRGVVASEGPGGRYVASRIDSTGADFSPQRLARNEFTWTRESATAWNSTLRWTDRDGRPRSRLYALHQYGR